MTITIADHLAKYGILPYQSEAEYHSRCIAELRPQQYDKLIKLRTRMQRNKRLEDYSKFFDFTSTPIIGAVDLSRATNGICNVGQQVVAKIVGAKKILDVGCSLGYLTTWYALQNPAAEVVGIDISKRMIEVAKAKARDLSVANIRFEAWDFVDYPDTDKFDAVIATSLTYDNRFALYIKASQLLADDGFFIETICCDTAASARERLHTMALTRLNAHMVELVHRTDMGSSSVDLMIVATKALAPQPPNFDALYATDQLVTVTLTMVPPVK